MCFHVRGADVERVRLRPLPQVMGCSAPSPETARDHLRSVVTPVGERLHQLWRARHGYHGDVSRRNPALAIVVGIVLLAIGFVVPGATRDLILRVAGVLALLAGAAMWVASRRP